MAIHATKRTVLFHLWNHNQFGKRSLEDVIGIMGHQMRALGYHALWDPTNDTNADGSFMLKFGVGDDWNVIVEGFTEDVIKVIEAAHQQGSRFICLATEEPTEKGFNHGINREMVLRQKAFPEAAKFFDGILHLVPGEKITRWYGQFAPAYYCELGYAPTLIRQETILHPKYDFGFFGSLSPRRHQIIKRLANRTRNPSAVKIVASFPEQGTRDKLMADCKVILQLRKVEKMDLVSNSRCNTALHLGRPVVAEHHNYSKPWDEIVKFADNNIESFFYMAMATKAAWRGVHAHQLEQLKKMLPPEKCIGIAMRDIEERVKQQKAA